MAALDFVYPQHNSLQGKAENDVEVFTSNARALCTLDPARLADTGELACRAAEEILKVSSYSFNGYIFVGLIFFGKLIKFLLGLRNTCVNDFSNDSSIDWLID